MKGIKVASMVADVDEFVSSLPVAILVPAATLFAVLYATQLILFTVLRHKQNAKLPV